MTGGEGREKIKLRGWGNNDNKMRCGGVRQRGSGDIASAEEKGLIGQLIWDQR